MSQLEQGETTEHLERLMDLLDVLGLELVVRPRRERTAFGARELLVRGITGTVRCCRLTALSVLRTRW